jgi:hypothetical protein
VQKVHNKPIKRPRKRVQTKEQRANRRHPGLAHWTVRCTRGLQAELFTFRNFQRRSTIIHRTVRCTTGQCPVPQGRATLNLPASGIRSAIIHRTCPVHTGLSGEPAEQRLLRRQRSPTEALNARQSAQKSGTRETAHRTIYSTCLVHHRTARRPHQSELQWSNPNDRVTWLAHRTLSGAPCDSSLHQTASLVVGAINTPNHPTFKSSKFSYFNYLQEL